VVDGITVVRGLGRDFAGIIVIIVVDGVTGVHVGTECPFGVLRGTGVVPTSMDGGITLISTNVVLARIPLSVQLRLVTRIVSFGMGGGVTGISSVHGSLHEFKQVFNSFSGVCLHELVTRIVVRVMSLFVTGIITSGMGGCVTRIKAFGMLIRTSVGVQVIVITRIGTRHGCRVTRIITTGMDVRITRIGCVDTARIGCVDTARIGCVNDTRIIGEEIGSDIFGHELNFFQKLNAGIVSRGLVGGRAGIVTIGVANRVTGISSYGVITGIAARSVGVSVTGVVSGSVDLAVTRVVSISVDY